MRAAVIASLLAFLAGWWCCDKYQDSQRLLIERTAAATAQKLDDKIGASARAVEDKLTELKANERHTEKIIRQEVVKPMFSNVCATADYVRLFNEAAARDERTLSGKSLNDVSD